MKKILGLVISERKLGNSEILIKEIMDNIPEPCTRELIRLTEMKIEPCKACYRCLNPGSPCRINDDFNFIMDKIKEADALIIGMPVYFLGPHAYFKMLNDRMLGSAHYAEFTRSKPCIVITSFGIRGWEGYTKTAVLNLPRLLEMKLVDFWEVNAALPGECMLNPEYREHAKKLGLNLFDGEEYSKGPWECPHCGADLFRLLPDGMIECPLCSARGYLKAGAAPDFSGSRSRFTTVELQEHFKGWLVQMKNKYIAEREKFKEIQKPYLGRNWWIKAR